MCPFSYWLLCNRIAYLTFSQYHTSFHWYLMGILIRIRSTCTTSDSAWSQEGTSCISVIIIIVQINYSVFTLFVIRAWEGLLVGVSFLIRIPPKTCNADIGFSTCPSPASDDETQQLSYFREGLNINITEFHCDFESEISGRQFATNVNVQVRYRGVTFFFQSLSSEDGAHTSNPCRYRRCGQSWSGY